MCAWIHAHLDINTHGRPSLETVFAALRALQAHSASSLADEISSTRTRCTFSASSDSLKTEQKYLIVRNAIRRATGIFLKKRRPVEQRARRTQRTSLTMPNDLTRLSRPASFSRCFVLSSRNFVSTISAKNWVCGLMEIYDSHLIGFNVPRISFSLEALLSFGRASWI